MNSPGCQETPSALHAPPCILHGTVGDYLPQICSRGVRFSPGEPSFTADLWLASHKYASKANNSTWWYSGCALREAKSLANSGKITAPRSPEELLRCARSYWEAIDNQGAVLFIYSSKWSCWLARTAHIRFNPANQEVRGGITKWIEGHICLHPRNNRSDRNASWQLELGGGESPHDGSQKWKVPAEDIVLLLPSTPEIRADLDMFAERATGGCNSPAAVNLSISAGQTCSTSMTVTIDDGIIDKLMATVQVVNDNLTHRGKRHIIESILRETWNNVFGTALRRSFLSILKDRGWRVIKSDYIIPHEEDPRVFWSMATVEKKLDGLSTILQQHSEFSEKLRRSHGAVSDLFNSNSGVTDMVSIYQTLEGTFAVYLKRSDSALQP